MPDIEFGPIDNPEFEQYFDENTGEVIIEHIDSGNTFKFSNTGVLYPVLSSAPSSPENGQISYADGTGWDPGSGEGFYGYENGVWVKL